MQLTRRAFIKATGVGFTALFAPPFALKAQAQATNNVLVVIFLRGGADGLSLVVPELPQERQAYEKIRPNAALTPAEVSSLTSSYVNGPNGFEDAFSMNAVLSPLQSYFDTQKLAFIHAVGGTGSYSHFSASDGMEQADPNYILHPMGWLFRALHRLAPAELATAPALTGVAFDPTGVPSMTGPTPGRHLSIGAMSDFNLSASADADRFNVLKDVYAALPDFHAGVSHALQIEKNVGSELFSALTAAGAAGVTTNPNPLTNGYETVGYAAFATALRDASALIQSSIGTRVVALDLGGWDHHTAVKNGIVYRGGQLARGLDVFYQDLASSGDDTRVTTLVMSEFGRTAFENGNQGADHGYGTVMLAMGGGVRGQRVLSRATKIVDPLTEDLVAVGWPGLEPGNLHLAGEPKYSADIVSADLQAYLDTNPDPMTKLWQRDLEVTIDFRDVFAEGLAHIGLMPGDITAPGTATPQEVEDYPLLSYTPVPLPDGGLY